MRYRVRASRSPNPDQVLFVTFSGTPRTVAWLSGVLASVVIVTAMRRDAQVDGTVRVELTCYPPKPAGTGKTR